MMNTEKINSIFFEELGVLQKKISLPDEVINKTNSKVIFLFSKRDILKDVRGDIKIALHKEAKKIFLKVASQDYHNFIEELQVAELRHTDVHKKITFEGRSISLRLYMNNMASLFGYEKYGYKRLMSEWKKVAGVEVLDTSKMDQQYFETWARNDYMEAKKVYKKEIDAADLMYYFHSHAGWITMELYLNTLRKTYECFDSFSELIDRWRIIVKIEIKNYESGVFRITCS